MPKSVRRPTPALIVAIVALVAALAGSAIALPGKNTVKSNDIAKNAVRSSDVKNNSLKGKDIKESTLGKVPSAANADAAETAGAVAGRIPFAQWVGEGTHNLATVGPFTVQGECVIDDGGADEATLQMVTAANNSAFDDDDGPEETDWDTDNNPLLMGALTGVTTGEPDIEDTDTHWDAFAVAADGTVVQVTESGLAVNLAGHAGQCLFAGVLEQLN